MVKEEIKFFGQNYRRYKLMCEAVHDLKDLLTPTVLFSRDSSFFPRVPHANLSLKPDTQHLVEQISIEKFLYNDF